MNAVAPITFQPFNESKAIEIYRSSFLPHLRQIGCTYFVTFRLCDAIPLSRLEQWQQEREYWLADHGIDFHANDCHERFRSLSLQEKASYERYFESRLYEALDEGHGANWLAQRKIRTIVINSIFHFEGKRVHVGDFVVMPNHVHALLTPIGDFRLEAIVHSIKIWSESKINKALSLTGEVWMKETYDRLIRDGKELLRVQEYIRRNPVKAKLRDSDFYLETKDYVLDI